MSTTITPEEIAKEIRDKLEGLRAEIPTDDQLSEKVKGLFDTFTAELTAEDSEFVRKLRFAGDGNDKLKGSKYQRAGLGVADIEWMHNVLSTAKAIGKSPGPTEELENAFRAVSDSEYVSTEAANVHDMEAIDRFFERLPNTPQNKAARVGAIRAAMDTAESGYGSQLVGAQYVRELWEAPRLLGRVAPLINTFEMTDPTAYLPIEADLAEMLFVAESTANNSSNYDTVKTGSNRVTVTAKKFVIHQMWSGELEEDSIIPFVPFLRGQAAKSLAHYLDSLVVNGDATNAATGNINLDDADPADTKHYLAYDGIRHAALVDNTANVTNQAGAGIDWAALIGLKSLMVDGTYLIDWGHPENAEDLIFLAEPVTADKIGQIDELLTVDKYGPNATVLTGEAGRIGRHPLVATIVVSKTEADGKVSTTAANNTLGQVVAFNRNGFVLGWRRQVKAEVERLPGSDQTRIVYSLRNGFGRYAPSGSASSIESAAVIRNIAL